MITDIDMIMTDAGQVILAVPGVIPEGPLELGIYGGHVTLSSNGGVFARVEDIDSIVLDTLAQQPKIDLLMVADADHPPAGITHHARVRDYR